MSQNLFFTEFQKIFKTILVLSLLYFKSFSQNYKNLQKKKIKRKNYINAGRAILTKINYNKTVEHEH